MINFLEKKHLMEVFAYFIAYLLLGMSLINYNMTNF